MAFTKNFRTKTVFPNKDAKKFDDFQVSYKLLWKSIKERLKLRRDVFILITGKTGNGKSTVVGKLNFRHAEKELNFILNNGEMMFIPEKHFITDGDEFAYKMITEQGSSLWYDEARAGSDRQQWYDKVNKAIKQRKNTNRKLFNVYWFCMPLETEFDPKLAAHLTAWIWVKKRTTKGAVCELYVANNTRKGGRGLDIEAIIKREEKWLKENPKKVTINPTIHPEYCGRLMFAAFTKEEEKRYNELVKIKSATGKLTEAELEKWGIESSKTDEEKAEEIAKKIAKSEIADKMDAWDAMKDMDVPDKKKIEMVSFYLKLYDLGTFNKVFDTKKKKLYNIAEQLKKKV